MQRVYKILEQAIFEIQNLIDPEHNELDMALEAFKQLSVTIVHCYSTRTGHSLEVKAKSIAFPGNHSFRAGVNELKKRAVKIHTLGSILRAKNSNSLLYGGCRNDAF